MKSDMIIFARSLWGTYGRDEMIAFCKKSLAGLLCLLITAVLLASCGENTENSEKKEQTGEFAVTKETVFLETEGGYLMAEAVCPGDFDGAMPLVAIGHGFKGSLDSGGASELSERLARAGIAAIRMDFNPRTRPEKDAKKTNLYDLASMENAMLCGVQYMRENYDIDSGRIGLYARSMGGRVVMRMANESAGGFDYKALAMVAPAGNENAMIYYVGGRQKWDKLKENAKKNGFTEYQGLKLTPDWFQEFEDYNPCDFGYKFADKPVLVITNTLDHVVTCETSLACAASYKNSRVITVTTDNYHGYEMSYKESELKEYLMGEIVDFFKTEL